jgi:carbon storage regulator
MLILTRKESERIYLGDDIVLTVVRIGGDKVRIGVEAPSNVRVLRLELSEPDSQGPRRQEPSRQEPRRRAA